MGVMQMNEGLSRQQLLEILKENKLLTDGELQRIEALAPQADAQPLSQALVAQGMLTPFQMETILNRKPEKLKIGNYDVLDKLGTGGTGTVFKARHRRMKRVVALKVLARNLGKDKTFVQRFQREVETLAQLSHPNIVMAYDADEAKVGHFLVMEFVSGKDLASIVQDQGPLGLAEALDVILQTAHGLAYVHERGMIHRDMKPANLLRDAAGTVKITDLGLARLSSSGVGPLASNALTQAGGVLGTVDYMPPEQALDSTNLDHRSDIYSLGATLYYLLIGQPVYPGQTMMDTLLKHRDAPIPSLATARPDVPAALDDLFRRMLAKSVAERTQTMAEVVKALEEIRANLGTSAPPSPVSPATPSPAPSHPDATAPAPRAVSEHTMDLPSFAAVRNADLTVLLVEPSRTQARIVWNYLQSQNIQHFTMVSSGRAALNAIQKDCPHAIISAMYLADMTGVELVQQIHALGLAPVPGFVLISSAAENPDAEPLSQAGQTVILEKPFTPEKLMDALSRVTGQTLEVLPTNAEQLGVSLVRPVMLNLPKASAAKLRALIVDDSKPARMHVRNVLATLGLTQVSEAEDGAQAVAILARETMDLIITDYNMPIMDGGNLVSYLKQNPTTASMPIIMVTTETDPVKLEAVRRLNVTAICDKSFPAAVVQRIIDQLLNA